MVMRKIIRHGTEDDEVHDEEKDAEGTEDEEHSNSSSSHVHDP
jgi:hypothetical protein